MSEKQEAKRYSFIGNDCPPKYRWVGTIDVADPADVNRAIDRGQTIGAIYHGGTYSVAEPCAADVYELQDEQMSGPITIDEVMEQAQVFASAYALVGGRFDDGSKFSQSQNEKEDLEVMVRELVSGAILAEREVSHKRGLREGIDEALQIAVEQAGLMADLALEGVEENARVREAMEAALTRFSQKLAVMLADLSHPDTLTDEAKARRSQALDELGALDGELL